MHGHVCVGGRRVTIPGMLVTRMQENGIAYDERSEIANDLHPVRQQGQTGPPPAAAEGAGAEEGPDLSGDEPAAPGPEPAPKEE